MNLPINTLLQGGKYRIEKVLGQGGFGITYLALHTILNRRIAIKEFFSKDYCNRSVSNGSVTLGTQGSQEFIFQQKSKFIKEAQNISALDHPNIIKIYDIFEENNTAYYVMEYIEGGSLKDLICEKGALSKAEVLKYACDIGDALDYIHSRSMNHLDVKPSNIMLSKSYGKAILIDFGVSKRYDSGGNQTSNSPIARSAGYAPYEQYKAGGVKSFSPQTDVYSLAATVYYMLSGVTPPEAPELIEETLTFPQGVPIGFIAPISKGMAPKRADRYCSAGEFCRALKNNVEVEPSHKKLREDTTLDECTENTEDNTGSHNEKGGTIMDMPLVLKILAAGLFVLIFALLIPQMCSGAKTEDFEPSCDSFAVDDLNTNVSYGGHEWVDLGLSVKWATCNVGASSPSDYGNYYAWGETSTKSEYTEENSKTYGRNISDISGNSNYDAARANWGSPWRMPTKSEMEELVNKCTWTWTTQSGHNGYKVTSKTNGNSIFLPAAGWRFGTSLSDAGEHGYYWCSSPTESGTEDAYYLYFNSGLQGVYWNGRNSGHTVRPVAE